MLRSGALLAVVVLLLACGRSDSSPTPAPLPKTPPPEGDTTPVLDPVIEKLGYALAPEYLPDGFRAATVFMTGDRASVGYGDTQDRLLVVYPIAFSPEDTPTMREIGLIRPADALTEVEVNGRTAYLVRGGWSAETIMQGPGIDPDNAEWDYDMSLTLFFDYELSEDSEVGVALQAVAKPSEWTTDAEMVRIAESIVRVE